MIATEKIATQNNVTETSAKKKEAKPGVASPAALNRDTDLIARAQQGDPEAFATLFHAHKARIYFALSAHDQQCVRSRGPDSGRFHDGLPQTTDFPRRLGSFDLALPHRRQYRTHALSQEDS
jgi:hypothetical protein